jgi:hypothetical protein
VITFEQAVECIAREMEYSKGWAKGSRKLSKVEGVEDSDVHSLEPLVGQPYSIADFKTFAKKYWDEIDDAMTSFTPDGGAVRIRIIKVLNLLTRALMVHGHSLDTTRLAGKSSSEFPILGGGLKTFNALTSEEGCLIPTSATKSLKNESPNCSPLKAKE